MRCETLFKPSSKNIFTDCSMAVHLLWIIYVISVLFQLVMRLYASVIDAFWSPDVKGLTSWLSFVMSNCEVVTFPLVSWVRCGARLYWFLIFALFLCLGLNRTFVCQYIPVNDLSVMLGLFPVFQGETSIKQFKCFAQGHNTVPLLSL